MGIIGASLAACSIDHLHGFPVPADSVPTYTVVQAREIVWDLAETNFCFKLLALDKRTSGWDRKDEVKMCFAGGMLLGIPLQLGQRGLAALEIEERHRYHRRLAVLMLYWRTVCSHPAGVNQRVRREDGWSKADMEELERDVPLFYTQAFYEYFGRAAVIPMRLTSLK
jgi:hypothetical protein